MFQRTKELLSPLRCLPLACYLPLPSDLALLSAFSSAFRSGKGSIQQRDDSYCGELCENTEFKELFKVTLRKLLRSLPSTELPPASSTQNICLLIDRSTAFFLHILLAKPGGDYRLVGNCPLRQYGVMKLRKINETRSVSDAPRPRRAGHGRICKDRIASGGHTAVDDKTL
jgi:hypothetical protein